MTVSREQARDALATLLEVFAGPNYSGALRDGDISTRLERCTGWVKAEASEAASLIESCVPHGKPMLAQAQQRLAALQSLKALQDVAIQQFGPLEDPSGSPSVAPQPWGSIAEPVAKIIFWVLRVIRLPSPQIEVGD